MMKSKIFCLMLIAFVGVYKLSAQPNIRERRACLLKVISLIEDYEKKCKVTDSRSANRFSQMFVSENTLIYNDLIGLSNQSMLSVSDYTNLMVSGSKIPQIVIKNVRNEGVNYDGSKWHVECSFDKQLRYFDHYGILLSSNLLYQKDYKMRVSVVYDPSDESCKFESIDGSLDAKPISTDYKVFKRTDERDNRLLYNNQRMSFDSNDEMFFAAGINNRLFKYKDPDVIASVVEENERRIHMQYKPICWKVTPYFDATLGSYYKMTTTSGQIKTKNSGEEFGVNIGYTFPSQSKFKVSLNTGVGFAVSSVSLSADEQSFHYLAPKSADIDADTYERYVQFGASKEKMAMSFANVPLFVDFDIRFSKFVSFYMKFGVKNYLKMKASLKDYSSSAYTYGIYEQYDRLLLDERWNNVQFGMREYDKSDVKDANIPVKTYSLDAFGGLGVRISPIKTLPQIALDLGVQYQMPVLGMWNKNDDGISFNEKIQESSSILSYTVSEGDKVRMLNDGVSALKRQNLSLRVGIMYKF